VTSVTAEATGTMRVADAGERALVARITRRLAQAPWVVVGPGDDAAVVEPARGALEVITTDAVVEGVHFDLAFTPPEAVGHRALAVNLSDVAAMGGRPRMAVLSLALPDALPVATLDRALDGLLALADRHGVTIVGGNITRSPGPWVLDLTLLGAVGRRRILTRDGARPGDEVYVTGTVGGAAAGLAQLRADAGATGPLVDRCLWPEPRVRVGGLLGRLRAATTCLDLSDGLAAGLRHLADASGVGLEIDADALPVDTDAAAWHTARGADAVAAALAGGDDYELLFTTRPARRGRLRAVRREARGVALTRIGTVTPAGTLRLRAASGVRELPEGFEHFR
jgi:thiamine-monophosphate kinase